MNEYVILKLTIKTLQVAFAVSAVAAAAAHAATQPQRPDNYPRKPVRLLVGIPPGGGIDTVARVVAQSLSEHWGQSVLVDNRTGAGGAIAMEIAAQSAPDGYTLLAGSVGTVASATPLKKVAFDTRKAYAPIIQMNSQPYVLAINPALPTISESGLPGFEWSNSYALFAPAGTLPAIVLALNREVGEIVKLPDVQRKLAADGVEAVAPNSPAQFSDIFAREVAKFVKFFRESGIKL
jgi:tripartite-type tricarboxylate transporter receptor subunit TctC